MNNDYFGYSSSKKQSLSSWTDLVEDGEELPGPIKSFAESIQGFVTLIDDRVQTIIGDLVDPLENYITHHE